MTHLQKHELTKQAMFGVGKGLAGIPWREGASLGLRGYGPYMAPGGALLGGAGNVMFGDEDESPSVRLLKGLLYGFGGGAAASLPLGVGTVAGLDKLISRLGRSAKMRNRK